MSSFGVLSALLSSRFRSQIDDRKNFRRTNDLFIFITERSQLQSFRSAYRRVISFSQSPPPPQKKKSDRAIKPAAIAIAIAIAIALSDRGIKCTKHSMVGFSFPCFSQLLDSLERLESLTSSELSEELQSHLSQTSLLAVQQNQAGEKFWNCSQFLSFLLICSV